MAKTAWIFSYKLKKSVTPEEFMERTQALHDAVISKAKGFISWEHYVQDETWTDFVLWETEEDARNATTVGQGTAEAEAFYACIRMVTCPRWWRSGRPPPSPRGRSPSRSHPVHSAPRRESPLPWKSPGREGPGSAP